jgi:hypothetical protein
MTVAQDGVQHVAIVLRKGQPMCRVSIASPEKDANQVRTALAEKARAWIADYLARLDESSTQHKTGGDTN